ncbi:uncharacterized protein SCDLUD_002047 [Saccharomycodes ludwigii]|uniref:uncharacterized protein n=1 Tax=Saccharomycodes ludwigii TaxID=36035 RepID=UPI001E82716D|nr:hypothetical protein SCDLUD_002047 [Saccharomycodes ludwigii]KAH3902230.1 hypothetical protein SCDLUD_002047 [Saccharomycodes ludwigii]
MFLKQSYIGWSLILITYITVGGIFYALFSVHNIHTIESICYLVLGLPCLIWIWKIIAWIGFQLFIYHR